MKVIKPRTYVHEEFIFSCTVIIFIKLNCSVTDELGLMCKSIIHIIHAVPQEIQKNGCIGNIIPQLN